VGRPIPGLRVVRLPEARGPAAGVQPPSTTAGALWRMDELFNPAPAERVNGSGAAIHLRSSCRNPVPLRRAISAATFPSRAHPNSLIGVVWCCGAPQLRESLDDRMHHMATKKAAKKATKKAPKKATKKTAKKVSKKKAFEGQVYGEHHGRSRLTEKIVIRLRKLADKLREKGTRPPVHEWAEEYGVAASTISMAINGKTWTYL